jgi:FkbM family methyltransferase
MKELGQRAARRIVKTLVKYLPDRALLLLKGNLELIKKMDYHRHDIYLYVDTNAEYTVRLNSCQKEPGTIQWVEERMKEGDVLYDVGSNVGAYALVASKFTHGKGRVYAFEPSFATFANLCRNVFLNGCSEAIIPLHLALSNLTVLGDFNYLDVISGTSCHSFGTNTSFSGEAFEPVHKQKSLAFRMDDLIETFRLECPNLIKIDVDGIESSILEGAQKTLRREELRSVLVEINEKLEGSVQSIVDLMLRAGFRISSKQRCILDEKKKGPFSDCYNYIFVRKGVR